MAPQTSDRPAVAQPAVIVALVALLANDHIFKQQFPGWVTGKLSDLAGLFLLGALLAWLSPRRITFTLTAAALAFAYWKSELSTPLIAAWNHLGVLPLTRVADLSDLLALPLLALGANAVLRPRDSRPRRGNLAVALISLLAFAATSQSYTFKLEHHGGNRTVVYHGSLSELAATLGACGFNGYPPDIKSGKISIYVEPEPRNRGMTLRGTTRTTEARTVLIFDEGWTSYTPDDEAALIDRSIQALESCFDPPEVELPPAETRDAAHLLSGLEGAFVVLSHGQTIVHNPRRAETRYPPASTFKIPNMMIALETGVATGPDFLIPWDGQRPAEGFWARSWSQDHTLRSAMQHGVLWYYQEIARRIGRERMAAYVRRFNYGNRDISGPIDQFWLGEPLQISAREQVEFLRRFHEGQLGLEARTTQMARDIIVLDTTDRYVLAGKTGSTWLPSGRLLAWLVGYVERNDEAHIFALNLDCPSFEACDLEMRRRLALAILDDWEILPPERAAAID